MLDNNDFSKKQILVYSPILGDKISYRNDNLIISSSEGKIKYQQSCYRIFLLLVIGDCSVTTGIIRRSRKFGFSICFMTYSFRFYGAINSGMEGNTYLRKKQYQYEQLELGKHLIINKIANQKKTIEKIRNKTAYEKEGIQKLKEFLDRLNSMKEINRNDLLGIEGNAAKVYFARIFSKVNWKGRKPRIKYDYVNSLLDIGYTLLFNFIDCILQVFGFDVYQGVLHTCFYMRKSLVCDIMEPFRPIIDWRVRKGIALEQFKKSDFVLIKNQWQLEYKKSALYAAVFMEDIINNKDAIFLYIRSYYRSFMKDRLVSEFPVFAIDSERVIIPGDGYDYSKL